MDETNKIEDQVKNLWLYSEKKLKDKDIFNMLNLFYHPYFTRFFLLQKFIRMDYARPHN